MTAPERERRVVVAGSTFGRMYLEALTRCPGVRVTGLLARGSDRSRRTARAYGVPLLASPDEVAADTDLVCVAVRSGTVGGAGTTLAVDLLRHGVAVLHELPVGAGDVTACLRAARAGGAAFAVADLYRWLPSVRAFVAAARALLAAEPALAVDAALSIQPAYTLARMLADAGLPLRPVQLAPPANGLVAGQLGGVALAVRFATVLDASDTDDDVRFPAVSVHTASGTLTLTDVHGPVRWTPTLHLPDDARSGSRTARDAAALDSVAAGVQLLDRAPTHADVLDTLWPEALAREVLAFLNAPADASAAQRTLAVAGLWEALTRGVDFPPAVDGTASFAERADLLTRLRAAVAAASGEERDEVCPLTRQHQNGTTP